MLKSSEMQRGRALAMNIHRMWTSEGLNLDK